MKKTKLFEEFQGISPKGWKQKIQFDLKGADYNEALIWNAPESIEVKPFYHREDLGNGGVHIQQPEKWMIGQVIDAANAGSANLKARKAIDKGADSLSFTIQSEKIRIHELLQGIDLQRIRLHFSFQFFSRSYLDELLEFPGISLQNTYLHTDIIGHLARTGNWHQNSAEDHSKLLEIWAAYPDFNTVSVDMSLYQNAGANIVQQLAYGMAHANEYLNLLYEKSETLIRKPGFTFKVAVGGNYFFEIAKLRALRILWQSLAKAYNYSADCHIIASPSRRNKTIYDYNINLIRTTMEDMAAILGGANTINPLPYDAIYNKENEFGERIARNQLLILKHESHLDKVTNAVDGSYYIEKLTIQLAEKALALLKQIEVGGGFLKQLKNHTIQKKIKESAERELALFNKGQHVLVGTNAFRNESDVMKGNLQRNPFVAINARKTLIAPIIQKRLSEQMEQERLKYE